MKEFSRVILKNKIISLEREVIDTKDKALKISLISLTYVLVIIRFIGNHFLDINDILQLSIKGVATLSIVLLSFFLLKRNPFSHGKFIFSGLVLCLIADVILEISFVPGGCVFGAAHVLFLIGFIKTEKLRKWQFIVFASLCVLSIPFFIYIADFLGDTLALAIAYFILIFSIISSALTHQNKLIVAAVCFCISDVLLTKDEFIKRGHITSIISILLYYTALIFFALSCENKEEK